MSAEHPLGEPAELAAWYLAGGLDAEQITEFEMHLAGGCRTCAAELRGLDGVAAELLGGCDEVAPDPTLRERLLKRVGGGAEVRQPGADPQVWKDWQPQELDLDVLVRQADSSGWEPSGIEGVEFRRLFVDHSRNQMSALVRMAPGTAYPGHRHAGPEECLVLAGDLRTGDTHLFKGDYQRMAAGSHHQVQSTEQGCLLFIVSSMTDEIE